MKILKFSGKNVLIDVEDFPLLSRFPWYVKKRGKKADLDYVCCEVTHNKKKLKLSMHRLIMGMGAMEIDHINGNTFDNRKENLRYCTTAQQQYNRRRQNKHGYKGITANGGNGSKLYARLRKGGKIYWAGPFRTSLEAAKAYNTLALEHFGKFACLNRIKE